MIKKITMLAMAVGALVAFAVPAAASASILTDASGTIQPESKVVATSVNLTTETEAAILACEDVEITGTVLQNGPGVAIIGETEVTTSSPCPINPFPFPLVNLSITTAETGEITIGSGVGSAEAFFGFDIVGLVIQEGCELGGNIAFSYTSGDDTLVIPGSPLEGGGPEGQGCPTEGTMAGEFTLTTGDGTPVTIH